MRRKEIAEIRKQFSLENCNITRIDTTLITQGEITTRQQQTFLNLDDDDLLKYVGIFKKTLSGKLGKNLLNLKFRTLEPEMSWGFLQQIRDSGLKDEDLIVLATESIKKKLDVKKRVWRYEPGSQTDNDRYQKYYARCRGAGGRTGETHRRPAGTVPQR